MAVTLTCISTVAVFTTVRLLAKVEALPWKATVLPGADSRKVPILLVEGAFTPLMKMLPLVVWKVETASFRYDSSVLEIRTALGAVA